MSLFRPYSITYVVFFTICIAACWFVPTQIIPFEINELTDNDLQNMFFNSPFVEKDIKRSVSHYFTLLSILSLIWLPALFLIHKIKFKNVWLIHFLLLLVATTFILFMNADFCGTSMFLSDIYIGGNDFAPVITYNWYEKIIVDVFPFWLYEVVNEYVIIGFCCWIISCIMLVFLLSNKFKSPVSVSKQ